MFYNRVEGIVCVANAIGKMILPEDTEFTKVIVNRMSYGQMVDFIKDNKVDVVIDATMPYAQKVSANITDAVKQVKAEGRNVKLVRIDDERDPEILGVTYFDEVNEMMDYLNSKRGNIMVTAGNTDLLSFKEISNFESRIYARMVMVNSYINLMEKEGFLKSHFVFDKGVFGIEQNLEMIRRYNIKFFVSKDNGKESGIFAKAEAARRAHIELIVLRRPLVEDAISVEQAIEEYIEK